VTAADLAAVLLTVGGLVVLVLLVVVSLSLLRALREAQRTLRQLRLETLPLVHEMRDAVALAGQEVGRVDELVAQAEEVTASLEASSRVVDAAITNPLIKVLAVIRGLTRTLGDVLVPGRRKRRAKRATLSARRSTGRRAA